MGLDKFTKEFFRFAKLISVGRIDEVAARFEIAVEYAARLLRIGSVASPCSEHSSAKHDLRYP